MYVYVYVYVYVYIATYRSWWTSKKSFDSKERQRERMCDLLQTLRYSSSNTDIVVCHSLIIKAFCGLFAGKEWRERNIDGLAENLGKFKLTNCSTLGVLVRKNNPNNFNNLNNPYIKLTSPIHHQEGRTSTQNCYKFIHKSSLYISSSLYILNIRIQIHNFFKNLIILF